MSQESEQSEEKFSEEDIPAEIREYFDTFSDDRSWEEETIERMKKRDPLFTTQLWNGLKSVADRLKNGTDPDLAQKLAALEGVFQNLGRFIDDIKAATEFRRFLLQIGLKKEDLVMRDLLTIAYIDEAREAERLGHDPRKTPPFGYGKPDAPHLSPVHDPRLPERANKALAELSEFEILSDPREPIARPTPEERAQMEKGGDIAKEIMDQIERGESKDW